MNFRFQDVINNSVGMFATSAIACCLVSYQSMLMSDGVFSNGVFTIIIIASLVFFGWLAWVFRMYLVDKKVSTMPPNPRKIVEILDYIIGAIWLLTLFIPKLSHPVWAIAAWSLWIASVVYYLGYMSKHRAVA